MREETERKVLRQVVYDIEIERGIHPGSDAYNEEFLIFKEDEANELAQFLLDSGQATEAEIEKYFG